MPAGGQLPCTLPLSLTLETGLTSRATQASASFPLRPAVRLFHTFARQTPLSLFAFCPGVPWLPSRRFMSG